MKVGFSICDITPETGIYLTGYGIPERLAEGVHSPLHATVMCLQEEDKIAVVIGVDWCYVDTELVEAIGRGIEEKTGIPRKYILLSCSHTHSAPHTCTEKTWGRTDVDPEWKGVKYVYDHIPAFADAVMQAKENLRECKAGFGHGHTETGVSRRGTDENGVVTGFRQDPYQIYDSNMTVAYFRDAETDEDLGIFVHASSHNTCMGLSRLISSDWCGLMRKRIRDRYQNVPVLFLNGAIGDVGPRTNFYMAHRNSFSGGVGTEVVSVDEVGYRAASDALRILDGIRDFRAALPLKIHVGELSLPQRLSMTEEQANNVLADLDGLSAEEKKVCGEYLIAQAVAAAYKEPLQPELKLPLTLIAFGPMALVPYPFEVFSIFSLRLRQYGPFEYTLLTSNSNGAYSYMPDRGAFAAGGYEASCIRSYRAYVIQPEAGDVAVTQTLAQLRQM